MAITVKEITLWRREIENKPGMLARVLEPMATSGANLKVLMAYRFPGNEARGAVELFPASAFAFQTKGLTAGAPRPLATLVAGKQVEVDDAGHIGAQRDFDREVVEAWKRRRLVLKSGN